MRRQLQNFLGCRYPCSATVSKFGTRYTPRGLEACVLLYDVALYTGSIIVTAQHCWTEVNPHVAQFNPHRGDRICFGAVVKQYFKLSSVGLERLDYNVGHIDNVDLINRPYADGLAFSEYWNNVMASHCFREAVPCTP